MFDINTSFWQAWKQIFGTSYFVKALEGFWLSSNIWTIWWETRCYQLSDKSEKQCPNVSATPIGQMGLETEWFPLRNGVCLIMKKAPSDIPILELKKRELLLPLSFLITKSIKLDLWNFHYGPNYRTQGCMIRENNILAPISKPIKDPIRDFLVPLRTNFNVNGSVRWRTFVYLKMFHWQMGKNSGNQNEVCRYVRALS